MPCGGADTSGWVHVEAEEDFSDSDIGLWGHARDRKATKTKNVVGIKTDLFIPGKGQPLKDQIVVAESGKIAFVGTPSELPKKYSDIHCQHVPVLMPGMWECHSHFLGASPGKPINSENLVMGNPTEAGARNARALKDTLYAGFTSCVDLGGYAPELQKVIDEGLILGPSLYGAGGAISMTAGHGDVFEYGTTRYHVGERLM